MGDVAKPSWCRQCNRETVTQGNLVCTNCAYRTLRMTCTHPWTPELVIVRTSNGYQQPKLRCRRCYATVGHPKLRDIDKNAVDSYVKTPVEGQCAHCGRTDAIEHHHWAPSHLFADAEHWPISPLCPECHRLWHQVTRTNRSRPPAAPEPSARYADWSGPF